MKEAEFAVHVSDVVRDRNGIPRWVVVATFVGVDDSEPRCIEYRVRVVPERATFMEGVVASTLINDELDEDNARPRSDVFLEAELSPPAEGIPRRVFEQASQTRLLEKARAKGSRRPDLVDERTRSLLDRQAKPRRGRPPIRSLGEKLRILADVERAYCDGRTLSDVANDHHMSRSAVRDLLAWARSGDSGVQLFTGTSVGRRGGQLTPEGRKLLNEGVE